MIQPKISIITVTYNSAKTIKDTIESVLSQTYKNIEHIVIDGNSTDGTQEIIRSYPKIKMISENDNGIYDAMNKGIEFASGEVVGFLNSDDMFNSEDCINLIASEFVKDYKIDIVYGNIVLVKESNVNKVIRYKKSKEHKKNAIFNGWMAPHPSLYVKIDILKRLKGFNTKFKISADFELMIRLFEVEKLNSKYINKTLARQRVGGASTKFSNIFASNLEASKACKSNGYPGGTVFIIKKLLSRIPEFFIR